MKQKPSYLPKKYKYSARSGNLKAEAVGVVKGEKHFPVLKEMLFLNRLQNLNRCLRRCLPMLRFSGHG